MRRIDAFIYCKKFVIKNPNQLYMRVTGRLIVLVFCITAAFDVLLNLAPPPFGVLLVDYFKQHTVLAAALIAGFVGAVTLPAIATFTDYNTPSVHSIVVTFVVSALMGFLMQLSGIFPHLNRHVYGKLPRYQTFLADGLSGVMVATVYWMLTLPRTAWRLDMLGPFWLTVVAIKVYLENKGVLVAK